MNKFPINLTENNRLMSLQYLQLHLQLPQIVCDS